MPSARFQPNTEPITNFCQRLQLDRPARPLAFGVAQEARIEADPELRSVGPPDQAALGAEFQIREVPLAGELH